MPGDANGLARFRANPEKVRVAVRRFNGGWLATITQRVPICGTAGPYPCTGWHHRYAYRAVVLALVSAARVDIDGIDIGMLWSYDHPMATPEQREHYERSARK